MNKIDIIIDNFRIKSSLNFFVIAEVYFITEHGDEVILFQWGRNEGEGLNLSFSHKNIKAVSNLEGYSEETFVKMTAVTLSLVRLFMINEDQILSIPGDFLKNADKKTLYYLKKMGFGIIGKK